MNLINLFPAVIATTTLKSLDVAAALEQVSAINYVADRDRRGFYSENQNLLALPFFEAVRQEIEQVCCDFARAHGHKVEGVGVCSSWANRLPTGHIINQHTHANSYISGSFYLTAGAPIEFFNAGLTDKIFNFAPEKQFDPDNPMTYGSVYFDVAPGQLVIFPSGLAHAVREHVGEDRYSIAFNTLPTGLFGEPTKQMSWGKVV